MQMPDCPSERQRYVVSLRKTGLGDRLICLCAAWRFARNTRRVLIVDWRHSIYTNDERDLFSLCFEPASCLAGVPVVTADAFDPTLLPRPIYPVAWRDPGLLDRPWLVSADAFPADRTEAVDLIRSAGDVEEPTVVFNSCINDAVTSFSDARQFFEALTPTSSVSSAVDSFWHENFHQLPFIGLHVRHGNGGDIMGHASSWSSPVAALERCRNAVARARERIGGDAKVLLCTDSAEVEERLRTLVSGVVVRPKSFRARGEGEMHLGGLGRHLQDALVEMLLLARCNALIRYPAGSFFSFYAAVMKPSQLAPPATVYDLLQAFDPSDALSPAILF